MKCKNVYQENSNLKRTKGLIVIVVVVVMGNKNAHNIIIIIQELISN